MNVLINCEESGTVREAFSSLGYNAWSCDLVPSRREGNHLQMDALDAIEYMDWDLMIAHPPCTYLANSGSKHLYIDGKKENGRDESRWEEMEKAALFFRHLLDAPIPHIACENPVMFGHALEIIGRKYDQKIQPWQFGHGESKGTCFWLKNLPPLVPTEIVSGRGKRIWNMSQNKNRPRDRSVTNEGIEQAMD